MRHASEIVEVPFRDVEEAIEWDRRRFIKGVGLAVLTVQSLPLMAHASGGPPAEGDERDDSLIIHSGPGLISHVHDLLIPYALLKAPPLRGVQLTTTQAFLHRHSVELSRDQLITVGEGGTVVKKASSHLFTIALTKSGR